MKSFRMLCVILALVAVAWADGVLVSNFSYGVAPGVNPGTVWVLSRGEGDYANGYSVLSLQSTTSGIEVQGSTQALLESQTVGVHDKIYQSMSAENRRSLLLRVGNAMIGQAYETDSVDEYTSPLGLVRIQQEGGDYSANVFEVRPASLGVDAAQDWKSPLEVAVHGAAADRNGLLWVARGPWGIARSVVAPAEWVDEVSIEDTVRSFALNGKTSKLDTLQKAKDIDTTKHLAVWDIAVDTTKGTLWLASEKGLWRGNRDSSVVHRIRLGSVDTLRITGIWMDATAQHIVVESAILKKSKSQSKATSALWSSWNGGTSFSRIQLPYDSLDVSVSSAAFVGDVVWLAAQGLESLSSGLFKVRADTAYSWPDSLKDASREDASPYLWHLEAGVVDREVSITAITSVAVGTGVALVASTDGAGVTVSADSGRTWRPILNQKSVKGSLSEVRMVPSVMRGYGSSIIAYRLNKTAKVTIDVFSYDMRKVRNVVRNASRLKDPVRSSDPRDDVWDGRDDAGNPVAAGMYYVRVKDNKDHEAWGKVLFLGGAQ